MKYGSHILTLFLILSCALFAQNAFSQATTTPTGPTPEQIQAATDLQNAFLNPSTLFDGNTGLPEGIDEQVSVTQIPSIPKPGQQVNVSVVSYSTDLNKAMITWTLDGRVITSQVGATSFQFSAPASGKTSTLRITMVKETGGTITKTITVSPADVDLIYEAKTYAHPFYKGKKQYTSESDITYIAIPNFVNSNGAKIPASNLVYTWKINGTVQPAASGYGKYSYSTKGALVEHPMQITVEVSAVNSTLKASQSINIQTEQPELVLYENNPLLGVVYEKAIQGTFTLERPQVDFEGIPYFSSVDYKDQNKLTYTWYINGERVQTKAPNENYLILRNSGNIEGRAGVIVGLEHANNILQSASAALELNFKKVENEPNEQFTF